MCSRDADIFSTSVLTFQSIFNRVEILTDECIFKCTFNGNIDIQKKIKAYEKLEIYWQLEHNEICERKNYVMMSDCLRG